MGAVSARSAADFGESGEGAKLRGTCSGDCKRLTRGVIHWELNPPTPPRALADLAW